MGAPLAFFDVGGGLGVDYDGSSTDFESSVNYSLQEYANDVVAIVGESCDEAGIARWSEILSQVMGEILTIEGLHRFEQV